MNWTWILAGAVCAAVLLNIGAYLHARSMLTFRVGPQDDEAQISAGWRRTLHILLFGIRIPIPIPDRTPADYGLPFRVREIPRNGGGRLQAWWVAPDAPRGVVILYHGYKACKSALVPEAAELFRMGYACLLVDFQWTGGRSHLHTTIGYHEAEDVVLSFNHARAEFPDIPLIIYGRSMGGAAVLRAVARFHLDPDRIILESVFDRMLSSVGRRFRLMGLPSFPGAHLLTFWGGVQMGYWGFGHNPAGYAEAVTHPTLVMHGALDLKAPPAQGRTIHEHLAGDKHFELFEDAGHESCLARHPEQWRRVVARFLGDSPAGDGHRPDDPRRHAHQIQQDAIPEQTQTRTWE